MINPFFFFLRWPPQQFSSSSLQLSYNIPCSASVLLFWSLSMPIVYTFTLCFHFYVRSVLLLPSSSLPSRSSSLSGHVPHPIFSTDCSFRLMHLSIYINLRRSRDCVVFGLNVLLFVCQFLASFMLFWSAVTLCG